MIEVNIRNHIGKARAPDMILDIVSHYVGEAHGTRINTSHWGQLRQWYLNNRHREVMKVVALCDKEPD
jgi:hypothetical protein